MTGDCPACSGCGVNQKLRFKLRLFACGMLLAATLFCCLFVPMNSYFLAAAAFVVIGLGCAPIYPCIIHSTPNNFGAENSGAIIGIQMASAYVGTCAMPPLFGLIANHINVALLPVYLLLILILMAIMHELLTKKAPISPK